MQEIKEARSNYLRMVAMAFSSLAALVKDILAVLCESEDGGKGMEKGMMVRRKKTQRGEL